MAQLTAVLSPDELQSWRQFYVRWPFDDFHRYHRPAALVAVSMAGGDEDAMYQRLRWLAPESAVPPVDITDAFGIPMR